MLNCFLQSKSVFVGYELLCFPILVKEWLWPKKLPKIVIQAHITVKCFAFFFEGYVFLFTIGLGTGTALDGMNTVYQDQQEELIPSEDSVSIDDMDPIFYEPEEDEQMSEEESAASARTIVGIVVAVILLGLGFLFINRSRTKKRD